MCSDLLRSSGRVEVCLRLVRKSRAGWLGSRKGLECRRAAQRAVSVSRGSRFTPGEESLCLSFDCGCYGRRRACGARKRRKRACRRKHRRQPDLRWRRQHRRHADKRLHRAGQSGDDDRRPIYLVSAVRLSAGSTWQRTNLSGSLPPGRYYLVQEAAGAGGTTPLPTPDATGSTAMSATSGKVALVTNQTSLTCGAAGNPCLPNAAISDFVGYGTATTSFEAGPTGTLSNTTAALRRSAGLQDTDSNSADFEVGSPNPRNLGGTTPSRRRARPDRGDPGCGPRLAARRRPRRHPGRRHGRAAERLLDPGRHSRRRHEHVRGHLRLRLAGVAPGDAVDVTATVSEFRPGSTGLSITQLGSATVTAAGPGAAIPPTVLGAGGRVPPTR